MKMNLTDKEAYLAMYHFLDHFYELTGSDDVGALLGGMRLTSEGTMDPAAWVDWMRAIEAVKKG